LPPNSYLNIVFKLFFTQYILFYCLFIQKPYLEHREYLRH
jgi:hypothetical protein